MPDGLDCLTCASVGTTKAGKPKFLWADKPDTDDTVIVVLRTPIGYRGSNSHSGDRAGWDCTCRTTGSGPAPDKCTNPDCRSYSGPRNIFADFPGEILVSGVVAQGDAGRMGSGDQHIALMPKGAVFRTGYSGRLYGGPSAHYYMWDGKKLLAATWDERAETDIF